MPDIHTGRSHKMALVSSTPRNHYGSLQKALESMHNARRHSFDWRKGSGLERWKTSARQFLLEEMHWDFAKVPLDAEVLETTDLSWYTREKVAFSSCGFYRLQGYFMKPKNVQKPLPAVLLLHDWGGPMFFGMDRVVNTGHECLFLDHFREMFHGGVYISETFLKAGFAVLSVDSWHFGWRAPRGVNGIPADFDPYEMQKSYEGTMFYHECEKLVRELLFTGIKQLTWAGTTWAGLNYNDDRAALEYLLEHPEIDSSKVFVTGLSGGAYRTNILCALDDRIRAGASIGWMTQAAEQQLYNFNGAINVFCMLPGVWRELDVPDLAVMAMPKPMLFAIGTKDHLFPQETVDEAFASIRTAGEKYNSTTCLLRPEKIHCYDLELQLQAADFFKQFCGGSTN